MRCRKVSLLGDVKTRSQNRREVDPMEVATSDIGVDRGILAAVVQVAGTAFLLHPDSGVSLVFGAQQEERTIP
jgi:hypothetical protein